MEQPANLMQNPDSFDFIAETMENLGLDLYSHMIVQANELRQCVMTRDASVKKQKKLTLALITKTVSDLNDLKSRLESLFELILITEIK